MYSFSSGVHAELPCQGAGGRVWHPPAPPSCLQSTGANILVLACGGKSVPRPPPLGPQRHTLGTAEQGHAGSLRASEEQLWGVGPAERPDCRTLGQVAMCLVELARKLFSVDQMSHLTSVSKEEMFAIFVNGLLSPVFFSGRREQNCWIIRSYLTPKILWGKVLWREYQEFDETDGMTLKTLCFYRYFSTNELNSW